MPEAPSLVNRVDAAFAADGPLAQAFDGFEPRAGQRRLAAAVARLIADQGTLVAEAGTGIGKTLAYLVPAVLSEQRVLISTGTRTLQDQIFYKDIPALAQALGRPIRAAYMKGRTNYLCLHRFERLHEILPALDADDQDRMRQIADWVTSTTTGDRAEIEDLPENLPLWSDITATSDQCLGRECPNYADCFVTRMRDRAAEAKVVIVNHHLLCADASVRQGAYGAVIPECEVAVIDEAHQLEDIVTQYFGVSLSPFRVEELIRDVSSALAKAKSSAEFDDGDAVESNDATRPGRGMMLASALVQESTRRLFDTARLEIRQQASNDRVTITPDVASRLQGVGLDARDALARLGRLLEAQRDNTDLAALGVRARGMVDDLEQLLVSEDPTSAKAPVGKPVFVRFIEARGRGLYLRAAPIDVATIVRDNVIGGRQATLLTSATLAVETSFDYALGRLGVPDAETLRVPSEFDYRTNALVYLPADMPDPRSPEFNRAAAGVIAELLDRTRGRAFVLFTSYNAMHDVRGRLEGRLPWPMLVQGTASRTALLREFRATPHAVLFATASFWQGVDVAGDALSCVIVDRLPFASPGDPLVAARMQATAARGGHPFNEYQVPLATLTLLQGLGRLIRSHTDRGVLAVLDPRLTRMSYGRKFLASFPPAPITDDLDDVARFFRAEAQA